MAIDAESESLCSSEDLLSQLWGSMKVVVPRLCRAESLSRIAAVGVALKPVGKPDVANPPVRFDERGRETGRLPVGSGTAPFLDSTQLGPATGARPQKLSP